MVPVPASKAKHESGGVAALAMSGAVRRFWPAMTPPASIIKPNETSVVLFAIVAAIRFVMNDSG